LALVLASRRDVMLVEQDPART